MLSDKKAEIGKSDLPTFQLKLLAIKRDFMQATIAGS
jgi:hypothetical protein